MPVPTFTSGGGAVLTGSKGGGGRGGIVDSFIHHLIHNPITTNWVTHELGVTAKDFENVGLNAPAGLWHTAGGLIHNPVPTLESFVTQPLHVLRHPLRDPGYSALALLGLIPTPLSALAKVGDVAAIAARAGELTPEMAALTAGAKAGTEAYGLASAVGKGGEYARAVNPETGVARSVGSQVGNRIFKGLPQEERILKIKKTPEEMAAQATATAKAEPQQLSIEDALKPEAALKDPTVIPGEKGGELSNPEYLIQKGAKYSRDPTIRASQKLVDKLYSRFPDDTAPLPWRVARKVLGGSQVRRFEQAQKAQQLEIGKSFSREGQALVAKHGDKTDAEHLAARMVLEGTLPHQRVLFHQRMLDSGTLSTRATAETKKMLDLIPQAAEHLTEKTYTLADGSTHILPVLKDSSAHLEDYLTDLRSLSAKRQLGAKTAGVLNDESALRRTLAPLNLVIHGRLPENVTYLKKQIAGYKRQHMDKAAEAAQRKLDEELGQMHFDSLKPHEELLKGELGSDLANQAGLTYVPYNFAKRRLTDFGSTSFRKAYKGGKKAPPGTFTHRFNATVLKNGGGEANVAKLMAESFTEAQRFLGFKAIRDHILNAAQLTPEGIPEEFRRLIRDDRNIKGGAATQAAALEHATRPSLTPEQQLLDTDEAALTQAHTIWGGKLYEGIRQHFFPTSTQVEGEIGRSLTDRLFGRNGEQFQAVPGYKWIDSRMLGGLDKANPLFSAFENKWARKAIHGVDAINAVQKAMILYLKPAYIVPNLLGNTALALIHQGFLAPWNLARSFKMFRSMKPETAAGIKALVGEGITSSGLRGGGLGAFIHRGTERAAKFYGKVVDDPIRFSAFLHEASLSGFNSGAELDALLRDPRFSNELQNISSRANDAMINYERLGPGEQAVMRRLVFFYPWVKGSTRYVNLYLKEHPTGAGLQGSSGQEGTDWIKRTLGDVPSFAEGIFPHSTSNPNFPTVINPQAAAIFGEPAHIAKMLQNIVSPNPLHGLEGAAELTPVDSALLALLTSGFETTTAHPAAQTVIESALHQTFGGIPLASLLNQLGGAARSGAPLSKSIYPDARFWPTINRFAGLGNLTPTIYNRSLGEAKAKKELNPTGFVGGG